MLAVITDFGGFFVRSNEQHLNVPREKYCEQEQGFH